MQQINDRSRDTKRTIEAEKDNVAKTVTVSYTLTQRLSKQFNHVPELNKQILNSSDTPRAEAERTIQTDRQRQRQRRGGGLGEKDSMRERERQTDNLAQTAKVI